MKLFSLIIVSLFVFPTLGMPVLASDRPSSGLSLSSEQLIPSVELHLPSFYERKEDEVPSMIQFDNNLILEHWGGLYQVRENSSGKYEIIQETSEINERGEVQQTSEYIILPSDNTIQLWQKDPVFGEIKSVPIPEGYQNSIRIASHNQALFSIYQSFLYAWLNNSVVTFDLATSGSPMVNASHNLLSDTDQFIGLWGTYLYKMSGTIVSAVPLYTNETLPTSLDLGKKTIMLPHEIITLDLSNPASPTVLDEFQEDYIYRRMSGDDRYIISVVRLPDDHSESVLLLEREGNELKQVCHVPPDGIFQLDRSFFTVYRNDVLLLHEGGFLSSIPLSSLLSCDFGSPGLIEQAGSWLVTFFYEWVLTPQALLVAILLGGTLFVVRRLLKSERKKTEQVEIITDYSSDENSKDQTG